jgi:hypothetical protein
MTKKILLGLCSLMSAYYADAQYAFAPPVGITTVNTTVSPATINLTTIPAIHSNLSGAIWNYNTVDFNHSFTIDYDANVDLSYGSGADGYVVVFKQNPSLTSIGDPAGYLGYYNGPDFNTNAFGIEFDDFDNGVSFEDPAPYFDHIAITKNGSLAPTDLISPATHIVSGASIKDHLTHHYTIEWICSLNTLNVYVDGIIRNTTTTTDYRGLFTNPGAVTWGFTAGIGSSGSNHVLQNIVLKSNDVCAQDCKYDPVLQTNTPAPGVTQFIINPNGSNVIIAGYQWDFGDGTGTVITSTPSVTHAYSVSGGYTVTVKILGYNTTTAECCPYIYKTDVKVDNGGQGKRTMNSVNPDVPADFTVSPNPAKNEINISADGFKFKAVRLFNINGTKEIELSLDPTANKAVDLQKLSAGMYILQLTDESGQLHTQKLSVQR